MSLGNKVFEESRRSMTAEGCRNQRTATFRAVQDWTMHTNDAAASPRSGALPGDGFGSAVSSRSGFGQCEDAQRAAAHPIATSDAASPTARWKRFGGLLLLCSIVALLVPKEATAAPGGFPDLDAFVSVDPGPFTAPARGGGGIYFHTPDGLSCALPTPDTPGEHMSASCGGHLPGLPAGAPATDDGCSDVGTAATLPSDLRPYVFWRGTGCPVPIGPYNPVKVLGVGQKITAADLTCVVGADRLTACIDPVLNRGFVLQPSGSWTF